jgi:hypothetical protein
MARAADETGMTNECVLFVKSYLEAQGGTAERGAVVAAGRKDGFSESAIQRAMAKLKVVYKRQGFPGTSYWSLPGSLPTLSDNFATHQ